MTDRTDTTAIVPAGEQKAMFIVPSPRGARGASAQIEVRIGNDTVWLTQRQMGELFDSSSDNVGLHLKNIYADEELAERATTEDFSVVQAEGRRKVRRNVKHYNLDAIISVGYRVNSKRGIAFRQWATGIIKQRLLDDYKKRTNEAARYLAGIKNVEMLAHQADTDAGVLLDLIGRYARSWRLLLQYDENKLPPPPTQPSKRMARLTPNQANEAIVRFRKTLSEAGQATELFGKGRGDALAGILRNLEQTWSGAPLYPNVDTRAANLLYMVIKDHPFLDGNKRIGSLLFLHYLGKNSRPLPEENALVALALLIAESDPKHKDIIVRLVISLLSDGAANKQN
jgi:prophage maintenance system killer protein